MNKTALALTIVSLIALAGCRDNGGGSSTPSPAATIVDTLPPQADLIYSDVSGDLDYNAQTVLLLSTGQGTVSGHVLVKNTLTEPVTLNTSSEGHVYISANNENDSPALSTTDDCPATIPAGDTCLLTVTFDATDVIQGVYRQFISVEGYVSDKRVQSATQIEVHVSNPSPLSSTTAGAISVSSDHFASNPNFGHLSITVPTNGPIKNLKIGDLSPYTLDITNCGDVLLPGDTCDVYYDGRLATGPITVHVTAEDFIGTQIDESLTIRNYDSSLDENNDN